MAKRVGVLGGTFDPPHLAHLVAATWTLRELGLDRVLLVVANDPWQKSAERRITSARARLAMVEAAVEDIDGVEACALEIERGGPSYMVDTLRQLRQLEPDAELLLIVGADAASEIGTWNRPEQLEQLASLVVVERGGLDSVTPGPMPVAETVRIPRLDISSTELRGRIAAGLPVDLVVPPAVVDCIERLGTYL